MTAGTIIVACITACLLTLTVFILWGNRIISRVGRKLRGGDDA